MFAFAVGAFYESLKFRPAGKKCQVEFVGYANDGFYDYGCPQCGRGIVAITHSPAMDYVTASR